MIEACPPERRWPKDGADGKRSAPALLAMRAGAAAAPAAAGLEGMVSVQGAALRIRLMLPAQGRPEGKQGTGGV